MMFRCSRCNGEFRSSLVDGKYRLPDKCATPQCKSQAFEPVAFKAITIDSQHIKSAHVLFPHALFCTLSTPAESKSFPTL